MFVGVVDIGLGSIAALANVPVIVVAVIATASIVLAIRLTIFLITIVHFLS